MRKKINELKEKFVTKVCLFSKDKKGLEGTQWIVGMLIAIIIGGVILGLLRGAAPGLFNQVISKLQSIFSL